MTGFIFSQKAITLCEILVIILLIFILIWQSKRNKDIQERKNISNAKLRNAKLEEKLKNPESKEELHRQSSPFEIQYMQNAPDRTGAVSEFQVEIEVHTETSVQRHLFDLEHEVTIGQEPGNDPRKGCSIMVKDHSIYVKCQNTSSPVYVQRGKRTHLVKNQMVKLQSKDILTVGKTDLLISLYEN
nr:hypothetical protein [uncultured Blautia sp.]